MKYSEVMFVDSKSPDISLNEQMVEAVKTITDKLIKFPTQRGYRQKLDSFEIKCDFNGESDLLRVIGSIEHVQRGYTHKEMLEGMAEALMDWDKRAGRRQ